jgi:hypothetical protein
MLIDPLHLFTENVWYLVYFLPKLHQCFPFKDGSKNDRDVIDLDDAASANQKRMNADPFEVMLMNMGYHITSVQGDEGDGGDEGAREAPAINCRPS